MQDRRFDRCRLIRGMRNTCLAVTLALIPAAGTFAEDPQTHTSGDPAVRAAVDIQLQRIYELANGPGVRVELLTKDNPLEVKDALGTELSGSVIGGSEGRIVGTVWTRQGKYSVEFYRDGDKLLMVYETFTYFMESAPPDVWRNFMGLPAWERRIYFGPRGEVGYAETRGREAPSPESRQSKLQQQAERLARLLDSSPARWERK
jgi:hypothetical protein